MDLNILNRTIFEYIRREIVRLGYLPDIRAYGTKEEYVAAKEALQPTLPGKALIEAFGVGNPAARAKLEMQRFVIDRKRTTAGSLKGAPAYFYEEQPGGNFNKIQYPEKSTNVHYSIRVVSNDVEHDSLMCKILFDVFGEEKWIPIFNPTSGNLDGEVAFISKVSDIDVTATNKIERLYEFMIEDVWVGEFTTLLTNIKPLIEVGVKITTGPLVEGTVPNDETEFTVTEEE